MDQTIITLASVPAILAAVNLLKGLGLTGKWAALTAVVVAAAFVMGEAYVEPELWSNITAALILGLSASGLYDVATGIHGKTDNVILAETVISDTGKDHLISDNGD